ncbi:hypothetical protein TSAR_001174 [Trichomalopsis sarcophagae]|uniref:Odorant receptor n=1 Tax=Trichomalopsis sarcophagae TaxID=543379 RepID=A0A232FMW3_9HYME|nr:hypothetical protein TSAR_001174 [Trichomalopsis sarcophagae]
MPSLLVCVLEESFTRLENTGHLTKHGGKFKTWRKRYFIPKKCALCYWNSQNDIYRKPSTPDPARQSLQVYVIRGYIFFKDFTVPETDGDLNCLLPMPQRHQLLLHSKKNITNPLTKVKKMASLNPEYYFDLNIKLMSLCGIKCSMTETIGSFINKIPTILSNLVGLVYLIFQVNLLRDVVHLRDTVLAVQILSEIVCNVQCNIKGLFFVFSINKVQYMLHEIRILWESYPPDNELQKSIFLTADQTLTFCKYYVTANLSCVLAYALQMGLNFFTQYRTHQHGSNHTYDLSHIIILVKYPFVVTGVPTFITLFFTEEFLLIMCATLWAIIDTLFAQVTTHMCLQFKILKRDIEEKFNSKSLNRKEFLLDQVRRHRNLLRVIEDVFSPIVFFTVFLSSVNMCFNVIGTRETISNKDYFDTGIYATILTMTIFQIFFFCIFAEKLSDETTSLADTVYNLNWTTKDYKLRFYLQVIIVRAQKPFYCTAYGFFPIGHQRLTSILRASWSYYMMLQTTSSK